MTPFHLLDRRLLLAAGLLAPAASALATPAPARWLKLPPTPGLPATSRSGVVPVNGIKVWHAVYGPAYVQGGPAVVMLHGGLAHAEYWGLQIPALAQHSTVVVMDSRGHGRSTRDDRPYSYDLMADDVAGLLDRLGIGKAAVVGWSDGAILGLDLAMRHKARVSKVFAFAANTDTSGVVEGVENNPTFAAYIKRAGEEYRQLSPTPGGYDGFVAAISHMWESQPNWTAGQLGAIDVPVLVVDGDHDEAIKRAHTEQIAAQIPGAGLMILPNVSHFAFLQDPGQFTDAVVRFLAENP